MAGKKALIVGIMLSCMMTQVGLADMIILEGLDTATETTGDLLDGTRNVGITVGVKEIAGLLITARSGVMFRQSMPCPAVLELIRMEAQMTAMPLTSAKR